MNDDVANPVRIKANLNRVRAMVSGHVIADTNHALTVYEGDYEPVQYFPRDAVEMGFFGKTDRRTRCPFKGEASYYTLTIDGQILENVAWSYESTNNTALALRDYIAFYPDRVQVYELPAYLEGHDQRSSRSHGGII